ncbi:MAG TPA: HK97 gp10 family phage protein [Rhizomicrobium sp.]|jgi:hypothetical protein|nr:HK97 gp10 family phage protein [Rhizomicrobium sp.]
MAGRGFSGLDTLFNMLDRLPAASEQELAQDLPKIGAAVLRNQKAEVPIRTGDLWRGLSVAVLDGGKRIRVGLVGITRPSGKNNYGGLYYGRFVEFGRHGQVVQVERRRRVYSRALGRKILRTGKGGRKRAQDIVSRYTLHVKPMAARPYVYSATAEAAALDAGVNLADFWSRALARAQG